MKGINISTNRWLTVAAFYIFLLFWPMATGDPLTATNLPHTHRLLDNLFRFYRKEIRPVANDSIPVEVTVHLWFKQVLKVDEIDQILTVYAWVEEYWQDDFLTWDPIDYGGVEILHVPADRIWRPDLMIYNNADMNIQENELTTNAVLNFTGSVMCFRAMITKITCNLDMTYFPFDQQNCSMMLASWSSDGSKVTVVPKKADNNLVYYIENTEWKLLEFLYKQQTKYYDCCPEAYPDITYYFVLERNPSYYILNLIIPSVFITVVTMVGFFTPYSSTGENTEKVSLGVTALLSLAIILLMVADKMPATSKVIPLIGKYYIGLIWLIFAATIITTVTLRLQSKGNAGKPLSDDTKRIFFKYIARFLFMKLDLPPKPVSSTYQRGAKNYTNTTSTTTSQKKNYSGIEAAPIVEPTRELNGGVGETAFLLAPHHNFTGCYYAGSIGANADNNFSNHQARRHSMINRNGGGGGATSGIDHGGHGREDTTKSDYGLTYCNSYNYAFPPPATPITRPITPSPINNPKRARSVAGNGVGDGGAGGRHERCSFAESETLCQLKKIRHVITDIDRKLQFTHDMQNIRKEWEQLARVCERLLMFAFVFFTILFATLMLHFHGQGETIHGAHQHTQFQNLVQPQLQS